CAHWFHNGFSIRDERLGIASYFLRCQTAQGTVQHSDTLTRAVRALLEAVTCVMRYLSDCT
ncbi:MAG: hypothetical protein WAL97_08065, partial [Halobacteriota archaeon]